MKRERKVRIHARFLLVLWVSKYSRQSLDLTSKLPYPTVLLRGEPNIIDTIVCYYRLHLPEVPLICMIMLSRCLK